MSDKKLVEMPNKEFDKFMCEKFPELFRERKLPMNQTCMCWGFNIGKGWHQLLYDLCEKLDYIRKQTGLITVFIQIKEKFGSARFYHNIDTSECKLDKEMIDLWGELIDSLVGKAERKSDTTCSVCEKAYYHRKIAIGGWVYDACKDCMISGKRIERDDIKEQMEKNEIHNNTVEEIMYSFNTLSVEQLNKVKEFIDTITKK